MNFNSHSVAVHVTQLPPPTNRHQNLTKRLLAVAVAGALAKTATAPLDRVKILFQTAESKYKHHAKEWAGAYNTIQQIGVQEREGIEGLCRGHTIMLARIIPYAAVQFANYEYYKEVSYLPMYCLDT